VGSSAGGVTPWQKTCLAYVGPWVLSLPSKKGDDDGEGDKQGGGRGKGLSLVSEIKPLKRGFGSIRFTCYDPEFLPSRACSNKVPSWKQRADNRTCQHLEQSASRIMRNNFLILYKSLSLRYFVTAAK
jgi:hypothetical protein